MHSLHRRSFLGAGAALALGGLSRLVAEEKADPFGGFRLGAQSYTFREFKLEPALQRMKKLGLKYGEFYQGHCPMTDKPEAIKAFQKLCAEYGVTPWAWGVQGFTKKHDDNKRVFEFGKALGLKMFSASPSPDSFDSLDKLCDEYKIAIGIHPHGPVGGGKLDRWYSAKETQRTWAHGHCDHRAGVDTRRRAGPRYFRGAFALGALDPITLSHGAVAKW